ncbi:hypothetical protein HK102_011872, partial [Quaeritorhiza haematococci]
MAGNDTATNNLSAISYFDDATIISVFTITYAFLFLTSLLFYLRRNHEFIRPRLVPVVLITAFCTCTVNGPLLANMPASPLVMPCPIQLLVFYITAPLWVFSLFLRAGHLLLAHVSAQARLEMSVYGKITIYERMNVFERLMLRVFIFFFGLQSGKWQSSTSNANISLKQLAKTISIFLAFLLVILGIAIGVKRGRLDKCSVSDYAVLFVFVMLFVSIIPYLLYVIRDIHDAFMIRKELAATFIAFYPCAVLYLLATFAFSRSFLNPVTTSGTNV